MSLLDADEKTSLTQERRERLIAALPDEHFAINDVNAFW